MIRVQFCPRCHWYVWRAEDDLRGALAFVEGKDCWNCFAASGHQLFLETVDLSPEAFRNWQYRYGPGSPL